MSLEKWLEFGQLIRHETSPEEISDLLAIADRDIGASQTLGLPTDWRLSIAHNAALQAATAALAAAGFRAERAAQHYRVIQSLEYTIGLDSGAIGRMNALHKKRNVVSYTSAGAASEDEADEMLRLAKNVRERVEQWLRDKTPELLSP